MNNLDKHNNEVARREIEAWLDTHGVSRYMIMMVKGSENNKKAQFVVDVEGEVDLSSKGITQLPVQFNKVSGNFIIANNNLYSLMGVPKEVGVMFDCAYNNLTDLSDGPEIAEDYYCNNNHLTSLKGAPKKVIRFDCSKNELTNLEGGPEEAEILNIHDNKIETLEFFPQKVVRFTKVGNEKLEKEAFQTMADVYRAHERDKMRAKALEEKNLLNAEVGTREEAAIKVKVKGKAKKIKAIGTFKV